MAEELQSLLERIQQEGLKKVEAERERVLAEARQQAAELLKQTRAEADKTVAGARAEAELLRTTGEKNLQQAARDAVIALRAELTAVLEQVIRENVARALTPDLMAQVIVLMAQQYAAQMGEITQLEVLLPEKDRAAMETLVRGQLGERLAAGLVLKPGRGMAAGLKLSFNGQALSHDFTDEAVTALLSAYLNPRIVAVLGKAKG